MSARLITALFLAYAAASTVAFAAYGIDKSAARRGARRIPESTLHALALVGGWPGALAAQRLFRHKTRKASFRHAFWLTVFVNCVLLGGAIWLARA